MGAAVDGVKAIGVHVEREPARAADATDDGEVLARHAEFREGALQRVEDGVIAAAWAPADFVRRDEILAGEFRGGGNGLEGGGHGD